MINEENTLCVTLTITELKSLIMQVMEEYHNRSNDNFHVDSEFEGTHDIIYLYEACELTGYTENTIYTKVSKNEMPVVTRGKPLTFSRKELKKWIKNGRPSLAEITSIKLRRNRNR